MRKFIACALATLLVALTACDEPLFKMRSYTSYDGTREFISNFACLDAMGYVDQYSRGEPLDPDKPEVISYAMPSLDAARDHFLSLMPSDAKIKKNSKGVITYTPYSVLTGYDWNETDREPYDMSELKEDQPTIVFTPVNDGNLLATITFDPKAKGLPITQINVLASWPKTEASPYRRGDIVPMYNIFDEEVDAICVRERANGFAGVALYIPIIECGVTTMYYDDRLDEAIEKYDKYMLCSLNLNSMPNEFQMNEYFDVMCQDLTYWQIRFEDADNGPLVLDEQYWMGKLKIWEWCTYKRLDNGKHKISSYARQKHPTRPTILQKFF